MAYLGCQNEEVKNVWAYKSFIDLTNVTAQNICISICNRFHAYTTYSHKYSFQYLVSCVCVRVCVCVYSTIAMKHIIKCILSRTECRQMSELNVVYW